ncbi:MAG: glutamine--fructose-6-phosphate transaminase (isomerizing), partial [Chloroflexi bacterium]|nr:glutamine--fructose-6-phosphate transaminase (isomerizing) [Chloroflexota bacterium]
IGHVRWATHGGVSQCNAHPHLDCRSEIALVHNGIIDNYQELRRRLEVHHHFRSETDTEVVSHLMEESLAEGASLQEALLRAIAQLEGSYALVAISGREPDKIVATRKDSPLVVGSGAQGYFVASDVITLLGRAERVAPLDDGEVALVSPKGITILNGNKEEIQKPLQPISCEWRIPSRNGHKYFMQKEILEEPDAIIAALCQDDGLLMELALEVLRARQVVIIACGTSRHAALIGRYLFSNLAGRFCEVVMASEFEYFHNSIDRNAVVIAISQSGETADVIAGVKMAKANGARIISMVNVPGSTLTRMSDKVIYLNCGPELCVAATKSFISQLVIFYLLTFAMLNQLEKGKASLRQISRQIWENLNTNGEDVRQLGAEIADKPDFYFLARGINFAIALEAALKLKEVSYIHAEGMPAAELKHGTLALIDKATPVLVICPKDYTYNDTLSNAIETKARGAFVIGLSDVYNEIFDRWIKLPKVDEIFYPLVSVVPLQLLAYYAALSRGKDPDRPRNLAKSVTVK